MNCIRYRINMGKLGEEETKVDATSEVLSEDSDMDVKKETDQFIPVPSVEVVKKKRVLSEKQHEALQRGREKRLQLAKEKRTRVHTQPMSERTDEQKVEALLEKYLGDHVKRQAQTERKRQNTPIQQLSEDEDSYDSDDIPQKIPVLSRQKAYVQERKRVKQPQQSCMFL